MAKLQKPNISEIAFWDVKYEELDYENNSLFIMNKVFNYGTWADMLETLKFYGIEMALLQRGINFK